MNQRTENAKDWARAALVVAVVLFAVLMAVGKGHWPVDRLWLDAVVLVPSLGLLGWFMGRSIPVE